MCAIGDSEGKRPTAAISVHMCILYGLCVCVCVRAICICVRDAKYARAHSRDLSACPRTPGNRTLMGNGPRRTAGVSPITPGESRARKKKKSPAPRDPPRKSRRRWHPRRAPLKSPFSSSIVSYFLFAFRLIVENVRRTKMVFRGTLDTLAYFRLACRSSPLRFRFRSSSLPSHDPSYVHSFTANEK